MPTISETIQKVNEFAELPNGWHFGEGVPPSEDAREQAIKFLKAAQWLGIKRTNAFPGIRGQVQVTFYHGERMLELTLETDNSLTIAEDEGDTQITFKENASISDAYAALREFGQYIWASLESFIESTTIQNVKTSLVRLWIYRGASQSQWSNMNVRLELARPYVRILRHSIVNNPASLLYIGASPTGLFRLNADMSSKEVIPEMTATTISMVGRESKREEPLSH